MSIAFGSTRMTKVVRVVKAVKSKYTLPVLRDTTSGVHLASSDPLYHRIKTQCHTLGEGYDDLSQLASWIVDAEPDSFDDDHWTNVRPY